MITPEPGSRLAALMAENNRLLHAIQTGIEYMMPDAHRSAANSETTPKQLRVGINNALCVHGALAELLIDKGVFTAEEYFETVNAYLQRDVDDYTQKLHDRYGGNTTTTLG